MRGGSCGEARGREREWLVREGFQTHYLRHHHLLGWISFARDQRREIKWRRGNIEVGGIFFAK